MARALPRQRHVDMAQIEVVGGEHAQERFEVGDELFLGRTPDATDNWDIFVCLADEGVSRRHLRVWRDSSEYFIEDLNSTNGTWVEDRRLEPGVVYRLPDGARMRVGQVTLRFSQAAAPVEPPTVIGQRPPGTFGALLEPAGGCAVRLSENELNRPEVSVAIDASRLIQQFGGALEKRDEDLHRTVRQLKAMTQVSVALGAVTDQRKLATTIMDCVFDLFPSARRAFVLLREEGSEELKSVAARLRDASDTPLGELSLSRSIVRRVVDDKQAILSVDTFRDGRFSSHDSIVTSSIRSAMCAPLLVDEEVLGLIQVDNTSESGAFTAEELEILVGICAQTAIALKNFQLYSEIENLFEGFVHASVQAIESRDPTTAGHSFRVADYTERLVRAVDREERFGLRGIGFDREQLREIRYAALLHDFGKVGVREHVLTKEKKLHHQQLVLLRQRFQLARVCLERDTYRALIERHLGANLNHSAFVDQWRDTEQYLAREAERLESFLELVLQANEPTVNHTRVPEGLREVAEHYFNGHDGVPVPLLEPFEFSDLTLSKGSLTPQERRDIQDHVSHSFAFLRLIPWTKNLAGVPDIAYGHHEKLDGSGYPLGLKGDEISIQARMMTIADIFDALTSGDRPYKRGLSADQALDILRQEARANKIDTNLLTVFIESKAWWQ